MDIVALMTRKQHNTKGAKKIGTEVDGALLDRWRRWCKPTVKRSQRECHEAAMRLLMCCPLRLREAAFSLPPARLSQVLDACEAEAAAHLLEHWTRGGRSPGASPGGQSRKADGR